MPEALTAEAGPGVVTIDASVFDNGGHITPDIPR